MPNFLRKIFHSEKESDNTELIKQNLRDRYWTEDELQRLLRGLFDNIPVQDFKIRLKEDEWTFNAPRQVTDAEFRVARRDFDREKAISKAAAKNT